MGKQDLISYMDKIANINTVDPAQSTFTKTGDITYVVGKQDATGTNSPVIFGAVGGDLSVNSGLETEEIYTGIKPEAKPTTLIRDGNVNMDIYYGNVLGGTGGSAAVTTGNITANAFNKVDVSLKNGDATTILNGNVNVNAHGGANVGGFFTGGAAIAVGGNATSTLNGNATFTADSKVKTDWMDGFTAGISGGGAAVSALDGTAASTVNGNASVAIKDGLSAGIIGGGAAVSADATGIVGLITGTSYGNDAKAPTEDNENGYKPGYVTIESGSLGITADGAGEGGEATAVVSGDVNVQLTGTTTAAGILGGGLAAAEHQYGVKYDSERKGQASGSSYAKTEVGGTTNILVDLTQAGKDYSADSFGEAVGADGVDLQKLAGQNVVIGLVGGSTAAAFGDANSRAEATSSDVNIDLRKGYVAGTFGGGIAIAAHDKVTQKADGDSQISATSDAGNIKITVKGNAKAVGLFGNGLAAGIEYDDGYHDKDWSADSGSGNAEDDRNAVVSADSTNIVIDGGAADGVFGGGLALANGSYHGDSVTVETGTSYVTINNGTVDTFNFKTLKTSLQSVGAGIDKLLDTVSKDDSGDGPDDKPSVGEMLVGEKLNHYIDDLNNAAGNVAVAGGSIAVGQGGYAHTGSFVYDVTGESTIKGDIVAGGISDAVKVKSDDKNVGVVVDNAELNLAGGEVTGSVYVGGIKVTDSWETTGKVEDGAAYINGEMADSIVGTGTLNLAGTNVKGEISGAGYEYTNSGKQVYGADLGTSTLNLIGNNTLTTLGTAGDDDNYTSEYKVHDFDELNAVSGSVTALTGLTANGTAVFGNNDFDGNGTVDVTTKVDIADDAYLDISNIGGEETEYNGQTYHVGENLGDLWSKDAMIYDRTQYYATTATNDDTGAYDITVSKLDENNKAVAAESFGNLIEAGPLQPTVDDLFDKGWDDETLTDGGKQFFEDWSNNPTMHEAYGRGAMIGEDAAVTGNTVSITRDMADNVMQRLSFTDDYVQDNGWVNNDGGIWAKYIHRKYETDNMGSSFGGIHSSTDYDGAIVGVDFKKDGKFQSGIAFHYGSGDGDGVISHNDYDAWGFTLYGSIKDEEAHTNLMADVGYVTSDNDIDGTVNGKSMSADRDVDAWTIGLRGEKEYVFGQNQLVPYVGLRYMSVNPARYSVYYDGAKAFNADADNQNLWLLPIGVSFRNETKTAGGWRITPKLDLSYIWAFGDTDTDMTLDMGGVGSGLYYDVMDDNSWLASLGVEATKDVWSFGVGYGYQKGDDTKNKTWFVNASYAF